MNFPETVPVAEAPSGPGVYGLYSDGVLVYVGQTNDIRRRVSEHRKYGRVFDRVAAIPLLDPVERAALEASFIKNFAPKYNGSMYDLRTDEQRARHAQHNKNWRRRHPEKVRCSTERVRLHRQRKRMMAAG